MSDRLNLRYGLRGRLWLQTILLLLEGAVIIIFAYTKTLVGSVVTMCVFSIFTQSAEGAIYGVVPYVSKLYTGSVAGLVGSGGNVGSVVYGFGFRSLPYRSAFLMMGSIAMSSSILSAFVKIPCHAGLLRGEDNHAVIEARERFMQRRELEKRDEAAPRENHPSGETVDADIEMNERHQAETEEKGSIDENKADAPAATTEENAGNTVKNIAS